MGAASSKAPVPLKSALKPSTALPAVASPAASPVASPTTFSATPPTTSPATSPTAAPSSKRKKTMTFRSNVKLENGRRDWKESPSKQETLNRYIPPPTKSLFVAGPSKAQYAMLARKSVREATPTYKGRMLNSRQAKILANMTHSAANAENPYQAIRRELNRTPLFPRDREVLGQQLAFLYGEGGLEVPPLPEPLPPAEAPDVYTHPLDYELPAKRVEAKQSIKPNPIPFHLASKEERRRQEDEMILRAQERAQMAAQQTGSTTTRRRTTRRKRIR